jgi:hypothetical protein
MKCTPPDACDSVLPQAEFNIESFGAPNHRALPQTTMRRCFLMSDDVHLAMRT